MRHRPFAPAFLAPTFAALAALAAPARAGHAEEFLNVSGHYAIQAKPDRVHFVIGVSNVDKNADSALARGNRAADAFLALCGRYGVAPGSVATAYSRFGREYRREGDTSTYLGVKAETWYALDLADIARADSFLNQAYGLGMNVIQETAFTHSRQDSLKRIAADWAMRDARRNAEAMAYPARRKVGKLLSASYEKPGDFDLRPQVHGGEYLGGALAGAGGAARPLELRYFRLQPGTLTFEATVYAKFALED